MIAVPHPPLVDVPVLRTSDADDSLSAMRVETDSLRCAVVLLDNDLHMSRLPTAVSGRRVADKKTRHLYNVCFKLRKHRQRDFST